MLVRFACSTAPAFDQKAQIRAAELRLGVQSDLRLSSKGTQPYRAWCSQTHCLTRKPDLAAYRSTIPDAYLTVQLRNY